MQEKIEDIKHIQYSLWGMYKDFLEDQDSGRYKTMSGAFLNECKESLKYFCRNLVITWTYVVDGLAEDFRNGCDIEKKTDCVKHIQNTIWTIYKEFLSDHDMKAYNQKVGWLIKEYCVKGDQKLLTFCQWSLIAWAPIINGLAESFREKGK